MALLVALLLLPFYYISLAIAQCGDLPCGGFRTDQDQRRQCGVDPNSGSKFGLFAEICLCQPGNVKLIVPYFGVDNSLSAETTTTYIGQRSTSQIQSITFSLTGINTNIRPGGGGIRPSFIYESTTMVPNDNDDGIRVDTDTITRTATYFYSPVKSVFYTADTVTITDTSTSSTTTTTTTTTSTQSILPQMTSTIPCTTGTLTTTAKPKKTTTTLTATPAVKTKKSVIVKKVTVTRSCFPPNPTKKSSPYLARSPLLKRQDPINVGVVETHYCPAVRGPPVSTTVTTDTVFQTSTETTTTIVTQTVTSTSTSTVLPDVPTATVCSEVEATVTTTPTSLVSTTTTLKGKTSTVKTTTTYTVTRYPYKPTVCRKGYSAKKGY